MAIHFNLRNTKTTTPCYRSLNLLAHAQLEELETGSQCGGHGICGKDKVRILSSQQDLSPITEIERNRLTSAELGSGIRLACQTWPMADDLDIGVDLA